MHDQQSVHTSSVLMSPVHVRCIAAGHSSRPGAVLPAGRAICCSRGDSTWACRHGVSTAACSRTAVHSSTVYAVFSTSESNAQYGIMVALMWTRCQADSSMSPATSASSKRMYPVQCICTLMVQACMKACPCLVSSCQYCYAMLCCAVLCCGSM
jgi:hypothetical protein